jgi:Bor protein
MRANRLLLISLLAVATVGCFHQTVQTGRPAGSKVVDMPWVATWLWGLVPAKEIETRASCPGGVAVVETEQSFMNGLVGAITFGIFTPLHVRVTCSGGTASLPARATTITVAQNATDEERTAALQQAIAQSIEHHEAVIIRF